LQTVSWHWRQVRGRFWDFLAIVKFCLPVKLAEDFAAKVAFYWKKIMFAATLERAIIANVVHFFALRFLN
jgi:hypothetical protein